MSGAEAIAVLGIISSVIAIIDGAKKIYDGATNSAGLPEAFRDVNERLPIVCNILESANRYIQDGSVEASTCEAIKPLIARCEERAKTLEGIFRRVIPPDDASPLERYYRTAKALGKGCRVETLMRGLLEDVLLLVSSHGLEGAMAHQLDQLQESIQAMSAVEPSIPDSEFQNSAITNNQFGNGPMTNNNVTGNQKFQANYGTGKQFQAETQTFNMENENITQQTFQAQVQHFTSTQATPDTEQLRRRCEKDVLGQLGFYGMVDRYEDIAEAHKNTFRWIYEKKELQFVDWLRGGEGIYWISGKAGSGKSTLMKLLFDDKRTFEYLPSDTENTMVFPFFFHDRGDNPLLKSQEGLFRAILHSILSRWPQLIPIALPARWASTKDELLSSRAAHARSSRAWSVKELKSGFKAITMQQSLRLRLCLLIDGLDEFSGQPRDIVDTLAGLFPSTKDAYVAVQLCVSSRPGVVLEKAYGKHLHLRVQDLSSDDIKRYIMANFNQDAELKEISTRDPVTTNSIVKQIVLKAEGVFLWVALVIRTLSESVENGDNMENVERRLSSIPAGLVPLYKRMLEQIEPFYHTDAAQTFDIVRSAAQPLSPLAIYFSGAHPQEALKDAEPLSKTQLEECHKQVAKHLMARTAGLIEMSRVGSESSIAIESSKSNTEDSQGGPATGMKVQYLHLTVKEFISSGDVPVWLSAGLVNMTIDVHLKIAACCIRQFRATGSLNLYDYSERIQNRSAGSYWEPAFRGIVFMVMTHLREVERITKKSQLPFLEALDSLIMALAPPIESGEYNSFQGLLESGKWHWTLGRYSDWSEPRNWDSDYITYLTTIGMTRSVIEKIRLGYDPCKKLGRPLLLYATCTSAPERTIGSLEKDTVDPILVEALLQRGCKPNEKSEYTGGIRDFGLRTVWEAVLERIYQQFVNRHRLFYYDGRFYETSGVEDIQASPGLRYRWLETVKLFLKYGADPNQIVTSCIHTELFNRGRCYATKKSALLIFNRAFTDVNDPLVSSIQHTMLAAGATQKEYTGKERNISKLIRRNNREITKRCHLM
ncbi:small s protein [Apiospora arundinis]|uniref:Small s protein n=1 Tax=Apiospora arundinis TaxID=335852 RepID=A0ABR2JBJ3_9PEZI